MVTQAISGRSVGYALVQASRSLNEQLEKSLTTSRELDKAMGHIVDRRGQALFELAHHYLPNIDQQTVANTFAEVRQEILEILERKRHHEHKLENTIADDETEQRRLQQELVQVTSQLNEKVAQREELEKVVAERLDDDSRFQDLSKQALSAEQELNRNEQRVTEIQAEARDKLPSYEKSRLFKYLYERGFGTSEYRKRGLVKRLDDWVAKMIDYSRARRGYDFLRVTPELMAQEVSRRRDQFNGLMEQVESIEDQHSDEVGLTEVMRDGQHLGAERDRLVSASASQQTLTERHRQELLSLGGTENEYYQQAVEQMKDFLGGLENWRLENTSRATPELEDDRIVREIVQLGDELGNRKSEAKQLGQTQQLWKQRLTDLQGILQQFQRAEFDSGRSLFHADFRVDQHLDRYLCGELSAGELWEAIREAQKFAPPWYEDADRGVGNVLDSEFSYVLMRVLTDIAGQALRNAAHRGVQRRGPIRQQRRIESGRPQFRGRGFTSGKGF